MRKTDLAIIILLLTVSAFFLFYRLGDVSLADWDEGIYSNIAGEIASGGSWWRLQLQGTPWFEKEPLGFWLMASSLKVFGFNTFAVRFPSALLSTLIAPLFYLLARRFTRNLFALLLTLIFLFSPVLWHHHMLRTGDLDAVGLVFFLTSLTAYTYLRDSKNYWFIGVCVALNFLTRGFFGFLLLATVASAEYIRPFFRQTRWPPRCFLVLLAVSLAPWLFWHVSQYINNPSEYVAVYWKEQFFSRIYLPLQNHSGDWLFYYRFLKAKLDAWYLIAFGSGAVFSVYKMFRQKDQFAGVLVISFLLISIPLQIMRTKLNWYVLPVMSIFYLLAGQMFWRIYQKINRVKPPLGHAVVALCLLALTAHLGVLVYSRVNALRSISSNPTLPSSGPWYDGKVLPTFYWYSHFENKKLP